jgi:putative two-component system response regulator
VEVGKRILVVDDEPQNRLLIGEIVRSLHYGVEIACDGREALAKLSPAIDAVLLDVKMPGMDGFEVARRVRQQQQYDDVPIIMVTMMDSREDRIRAVQVGVSDFIAKPVDATELMVRLSAQLRLKDAQVAQKRHREELEEQVAERTVQLRTALREMAEAHHQTQDAHLDTIRRLVLAAELKHQPTAQHIQRLSVYSEILARSLRFSPRETELITHAIPMHDVGKIGIADAILSKPGRLTAAERAVMQSHTIIGGRILAGSPSELLQAGERIALSHHERWDGKGYPYGLAGENIPLYGRICAVVDVFDALTTERPYRIPLSPEETLAEMLSEEGSHFDPKLIGLFADVREEVFEVHRRLILQPAKTEVLP